ncbi:MAG: hypothetical protein ACRDEA_11605 [Microcystaceae cyanobacterium]
MTPTSRLYDALNDYLRQCEIEWRDVRHLKTLCWMMIGMIQSQNVHLNGFGVYVNSRAHLAQSHQRRFRRWLANRRIEVANAHQTLMSQALSTWSKQRLYLSLDTTVVWNCFCIVWVGVVYPWTNDSCGMDSGRASQQQCAFTDGTTGTAASGAGAAEWGRGGVAGRPRLCRWQVDEIPQRDTALALSHSHQTLICL